MGDFHSYYKLKKELISEWKKNIPGKTFPGKMEKRSNVLDKAKRYILKVDFNKHLLFHEWDDFAKLYDESREHFVWNLYDFIKTELLSEKTFRSRLSPMIENTKIDWNTVSQTFIKSRDKAFVENPLMEWLIQKMQNPQIDIESNRDGLNNKAS